MKKTPTDAYAEYKESLAYLLEIPEELSKKLAEFDRDETASIEQARKALSDASEMITARKTEVEREYSVASEKLQAINISMPKLRSAQVIGAALPNFSDAFIQLQQAGLAIDRAIRDVKKEDEAERQRVAEEEWRRKREQEKRRREQEERQRAEEQRLAQQMAHQKIRVRNLTITLVIGVILAIILFATLLLVGGVIVLAVTAVAVIFQLVTIVKNKPSVVQAQIK